MLALWSVMSEMREIPVWTTNFSYDSNTYSWSMFLFLLWWFQLSLCFSILDLRSWIKVNCPWNEPIMLSQHSISQRMWSLRLYQSQRTSVRSPRLLTYTETLDRYRIVLKCYKVVSRDMHIGGPVTILFAARAVYKLSQDTPWMNELGSSSDFVSGFLRCSLTDHGLSCLKLMFENRSVVSQ